MESGIVRCRSPFANIRHIYCVAAQKLILNVSKIRLRLIFACALYLRRLFAKALEIRRIYCVARQKSVLNVSERTGMSVVPRNSDVFAQQKLAVSKCTRMYVC